MSPDFRSHSPATVHGLSRRRLLVDSALGFGALAMNALLGGTAHAAASANPGTSGPWSTPHHRPRAKNVIFLYMDGGVSQVDTFDPKPRLTREDGKPFGLRMEPTQFEDNGATLGSPWAFRFRGQSGLPVSELFPQVGSCADDLCVIRSMVSRFSEHNAANYFLHSGSGMAGRPSMGAWATYGLGTENRDLPGYVVLDGGLIPSGGVDCFGPGFLPASHQASCCATTCPRWQTSNLWRRRPAFNATNSPRSARSMPPRSRDWAPTTHSKRPSPTPNWLIGCKCRCRTRPRLRVNLRPPSASTVWTLPRNIPAPMAVNVSWPAA